MRIVDLAGVPDALEPQLPALAWLDHDRPYDREDLRRLARQGYPSADYGGVFGLVGAQVVSRVLVLSLPFTGPDGTVAVPGLTDVGTRPDSLGHGYARRLVEEVHRRERAAGRDWALLWTHPSWVAHGLYEKLGYRDIYSPPSALATSASPPKRDLPRGFTWRTATTREFDILEGLLAQGTAGRRGLVPRPPNSFRWKHRAGWRPVGNHRILREEGVPVGYAYRTSDPTCLGTVEVVVAAPRYARTMIVALERDARGRRLAIGSTSFVTDHARLLRRRGYALYSSSHNVLMACPLRSGVHPWTPAAVAKDRRFSCHRGDVF
jgi:GNAT superfamily N-acetyltransferase